MTRIELEERVAVLREKIKILKAEAKSEKKEEAKNNGEN